MRLFVLYQLLCRVVGQEGEVRKGRVAKVEGGMKEDQEVARPLIEEQERIYCSSDTTTFEELYKVNYYICES